MFRLYNGDINNKQPNKQKNLILDTDAHQQVTIWENPPDYHHFVSRLPQPEHASGATDARQQRAVRDGAGPDRQAGVGEHAGRHRRGNGRPGPVAWGRLPGPSHAAGSAQCRASDG